MRYEPASIEAKWQATWDRNDTFRAPALPERPKFYVLDMFPYPSGHGLHVGHLKGYVASDVVARYKRMRGFDVLHPMGWDSFGLPTERQAERDGLHPAEVTKRNVGVFRRQLKAVGLSYDWRREFATSEPSYYRWTQWIFGKLFERGLAYQSEVAVNWCPALGTVVANEEVKDGHYIETGDPVEKRVMRQWILKITAYAERLLSDLSLVEWPDSVKELQRNWIGRSEGAVVRFKVRQSDKTFEVFSTRPDTLFGCTFCVLAPEHPLVREIVQPDKAAEVAAYLSATAAKTERDRISQSGPVTGAFTGAFADNPVNGEAVPIWISDYVIASYGSGAVFGCPAHDERDYSFAKTFGLDILPVISGGDVSVAAYTGDGDHINSQFLNGLDISSAKRRMNEWLVENGLGEPRVTYHLRDWLFSRQRYWGEPIPVLHLAGDRVILEDKLPVVLPPTIPPPSRGDELSSPLARARDWIETTLANGERATREANVMPQWAGSCWYYLRFTDPDNSSAAWARDKESSWMPVDLYIGGIEHATLHLLYARFWHKVLYDCGLVSTKEPFQRLYNQGMVHARSFRDASGKYYYPDQVVEQSGDWFSKDSNTSLTTRIEKMSKSRYNTVAPEDVIEQFGADALRVYEVFMGPVEEPAIWQTEGLPGARRFLDKVARLFPDGALADAPLSQELETLTHQTIKKVTEDVERLHLNTAISQLMILVNELTSEPMISKESASILVRLLAPFAPHLAEELWNRLGNADSVAFARWPEFDPEKCATADITIVVQINGRRRQTILVANGADEDTVRRQALEDPGVHAALSGRPVKRVVFVKNRLINLIV